ncbi:hypothetical protein C1645_744451 [Glomus cerebriforme]|uniref:PSP proline-rich domain-containing protein n=1 Tax=Glomus cerebriforme TaxID=658196 RepID=A0A397S573_9GLOM|nr:hypothetical protein C1645_744451 [Glomus cerebriforme]
MERDQYENLNQIHQIQRNLFHELGDNLQFKLANFSLTHKILSSIERIPPQTQFTPYISILPQKNDNLTENESFKRDTIIYLDHKMSNCDKEITREEKKNEAFAIIIETKSNNDINKFKEEILLNCGDNYLVNEDSIIYERDTDCVLGYEEKEKDSEEDDEIFKLNKLNHNVDNSLIISRRKCFNCYSPYHSYENCQLPLDKELIKINKEKFNNEQDNGRQQFNSRYYIEYEKDFIFNIFLPGVISDVLKDALGILESGDEPPYYKRMRVYGYPPGYWGDNEGDDPLKPKKDRLSKLEEGQWNSATLKIYDNNESYNSLENSSISDNSTDNDSENDDSKDSSELGENISINTKEEIIGLHAESQKETFEKGIQEIQESQQEKKKKVPLVYYPGLNLDFTKFENKTNNTLSEPKLNINEMNRNYYGKEQFTLYPKNTEDYYQYYWTMPDWYYNGYSENVNIENGWYNYNYEQPQPPGTTPPVIMTSSLEVQPPPPGTITSSFGMQPPHGTSTPSSKVQPPPPGITPLKIADKSSLPWQKNLIIPTTDSLSEQQQRASHGHKMKNDELSNVDFFEDDNDMDLSD